nr:MAG TPA: putative membrane protein [Caudoviricetes sp.]DAM59229.1 MAG TPA: putative membrane protein [Caudoviricetes sp.]
MEKVVLYAINERLYRLGLIDEETRDKIKAEISVKK